MGRTTLNYAVRSGGFLLSRDGPELQNSTLPLLGCLDIGFWSRAMDVSLRLIHTVESRVPWTVLGRGGISDGQDTPRSGGQLPGDGEIQFRQAPSDSHAWWSSSVNLQNWGVSNTWPQVLSGSAPLAFPPLMRAGNIVRSFGHGFWSHPTRARPPHLNTDAPLRHVHWLKAVCYCFSCTLLLHFTFLCKWTKRRSKRMESSQGHPCEKLIIKPPGNPQGGSCRSPVKAGWNRTSHSEASAQFWQRGTMTLSSGSDLLGLVI